jgi:hypothetical protein
MRVHEGKHRTVTPKERRGARRKKILAFLNTNLGLFLLSTVFISSFSWAFNEWLTHHHETVEAKKSQAKLRLEIVNRITYVNQLTDPFSYNEWHTIQTAVDGFTAGANVNPSWVPHYSAVFPEYQTRSLMSLLWELESLIEPAERKRLEGVHASILVIHKYFALLEYHVVDAPNRNPEGKLELLQLSKADADRFRAEVLERLRPLQDAAYLKHP